MELRGERILLCTVDPVERSLTVFINAVKTAGVNLHPEVAEKFLQFFNWIIFQVLNIKVRVVELLMLSVLTTSYMMTWRSVEKISQSLMSSSHLSTPTRTKLWKSLVARISAETDLVWLPVRAKL